jgi:signal transduction histidine kinase
VHEWYREIAAHLQEGILVLDRAENVALEANAAFYHLTGIPAEEVPPPVAIAELQQRWSVREFTVGAGRADGVRRWEMHPVARPGCVLNVSEYPMNAGAGRLRLWVLHDATEMGRVERARAEFMSVVSHEVRSPLASLFGYLSILSTEKAGPLTEMQRESLRAMHLSARQLMRLADDINDLLQSDSGAMVLRLEAVDLVEVVREAVTSMIPLLQTNGIRCDVEIDAPLPPLRLDPVRFHQILTNLVNNAIRFSEPGASIVIRAYRAESAVHISVRDQGPGIPPEDQERIFERFEKGQPTPRHDGSGIGLGLAVVRELSRMHGGDAWVESVPGTGSTFTVSLPITPARDVAHPAQ